MEIAKSKNGVPIRLTEERWYYGKRNNKKRSDGRDF